MNIVHADRIIRVEPGAVPKYSSGNPLVKLLGLLEGMRLAAERECYEAASLQHLVPIAALEMHGPSWPESDVLDPRAQDNKLDFQKQNVRDFAVTDTLLSRGWVRAGEIRVPFLKLSYRGGPDSILSEACGHRLGESVLLRLQVGGRETAEALTVPYNNDTDRYEIELWGDPGLDLAAILGPKGRQGLADGRIRIRGDLVPGGGRDFRREELEGANLAEVSPEHSMHPILPLTVRAHWGGQGGRVWDDRGGRGYSYVFRMLIRGWEQYLGAGISSNPHGGLGFLEYRNLFSNYGRYAARNELGRKLEAWNFGADGRKPTQPATESSMAVDYMDLHILKPECGIGLHRHRDNQEAFLMLEGQGLMVIGDWCDFGDRERCFEVRTLRKGHLALLKGGNLHGLMNLKDEDCHLFMFGGYD